METEKTLTTAAPKTESKTHPAPKPSAKKAPAKKTAVKKTAAKKTAAVKVPKNTMKTYDVRYLKCYDFKVTASSKAAAFELVKETVLKSTNGATWSKVKRVNNLRPNAKVLVESAKSPAPEPKSKKDKPATEPAVVLHPEPHIEQVPVAPSAS